MNLTKLGAFLGTLSFAALLSIGIHQKIEVDKINHQVRPPTLDYILNQQVALDTGLGVCSGWISAKDHKIHTAAHCFQFMPGEAIVYYLDGHTELWKTDYVDTTGKDVNDRATLVPKDASKKVVGGLQTCSFNPYYGEPIVELGAPLGIANSVFYGHIARPDVRGMIELDIHIMPGNSGGAIVDAQFGCVFGQAEEIFTAIPGLPVGDALATPVN